jgi:hypothetical protein
MATHNVLVKYTDEQLQLQSFISSEFIVDDDKGFAESLAYSINPTKNQIKWISILLKKILGEDTKYDFRNIFEYLESVTGKQISQFFDKNVLKMRIASEQAKYPGAIYMTSEAGYIGRINTDYSVVLTIDYAHLYDQIIEFLTELNRRFDYTNEQLRLQSSISSVDLVEPQVKNIVRNPFDPDKMNDILNEYGKGVKNSHV